MINISQKWCSILKWANAVGKPFIYILKYSSPSFMVCFAITWSQSGIMPNANNILILISAVHVAHLIAETMAAIFVTTITGYFIEEYMGNVIMFFEDNPFHANGTMWRLRPPRMDIKRVLLYTWPYLIFMIMSLGLSNHGHFNVEFIKVTFLATVVGLWFTAGFSYMLLRKQCERIAQNVQQA